MRLLTFCVLSILRGNFLTYLHTYVVIVEQQHSQKSEWKGNKYPCNGEIPEINDPISRLRRTIGGKVNMLLGDAGSMHAQELVSLVAKERR